MSHNISIDSSKIKNAVNMGLPVSIKTHSFQRSFSKYADLVLAEFLQALQHPEMQDFLSYVINELATNAKKANTKRVYFLQKNLDVNDEADYDKGMRLFKADMLANLNYYLKLQKETGLYIKIILCRSGNDLVIEVRNNTELTKTEFKRIFDKLARSRKYTALEDVLPEAVDDSEGSGLGILISLIMLRKIGMPDDNFFVLVENGETIVRLVIPIGEQIADVDVPKLSKQIASFIKNVPQFPDNIMRIKQLLDDPDVDMIDIAVNIASDVALSTDLLKLVNSAAFGLRRKIVSIPYAVNLVGIRGIRNLLYSIGIMHVLEATTDQQSELWALSYKSAFYAGWIASNKIKNAAVIDAAYVCGLLRCLGKIVLEFVYPSSELHNQILKLKDSRNIPDNIFNILTSEVNHPYIGAALAEKWNLPAPIINAIRFQHNYKKAPEEFRSLAALISFVNFIIKYQDGDMTFDQINPEFLEMFSISDEAQFKKMCDNLGKEFAQSFEAARNVNQAE